MAKKCGICGKPISGFTSSGLTADVFKYPDMRGMEMCGICTARFRSIRAAKTKRQIDAESEYFLQYADAPMIRMVNDALESAKKKAAETEEANAEVKAELDKRDPLKAYCEYKYVIYIQGKALMVDVPADPVLGPKNTVAIKLANIQQVKLSRPLTHGLTMEIITAAAAQGAAHMGIVDMSNTAMKVSAKDEVEEIFLRNIFNYIIEY